MYNNSANVINTYYLLNLTSFVLSTECNLFILNDTEIIMKIYLGTSFLFRQICHFYPIKLFVSIALNCWLLNYLIITSFIESSSTTSLQNGHLRSSSEMFSYFQSSFDPNRTNTTSQFKKVDRWLGGKRSPSLSSCYYIII